MTDKKQLTQSKRDFILSLKQLRHFFNNLKEAHQQFDMTAITLKNLDQAKVQDALDAEVLDQDEILASPAALKLKDQRLDIAAQFQKQQQQKLQQLIAQLEQLDVTEDEMNVKLHSDTKYFGQATDAIKQAERFTELINKQENETLRAQIKKKQMAVDVCDEENRELKLQLDQLLQQIQEKKAQEKQIRDEIRSEEVRTQEVLIERDKLIDQCQQRIKDTKFQYSIKIKATQQSQDAIAHVKYQLAARLAFIKQKNQLMNFYPHKVSQLQESLSRKNQELQLYQEVIDKCYSFVEERIHENEKKQLLISELNSYVGTAIQRILDDEKQFYESDTRDKLKVPPYNYVKRQPRDYTKENKLFAQFSLPNEPCVDNDSSDDSHAEITD